MHLPALAGFGHFLVHDAAAGGHPLDITCAEAAFVAQRVRVIDRAGEHVGDGLDAAVRVPREARLELLRVFVAEVVEQQEGIEGAGVVKPEGAVQVNPGAFQRWLGEGLGFYRAKRHGWWLLGVSKTCDSRGVRKAGILVNQRALAQQRPASLPQNGAERRRAGALSLDGNCDAGRQAQPQQPTQTGTRATTDRNRPCKERPCCTTPTRWC